MVRSECVLPFSAFARPPRSAAMTMLLRVPDRPLGLGIVQLALGGLSLLSLFAAERRLIDRDDAAQQIVVVFHHAADAPAKEPSGLLADAKMVCQFDLRKCPCSLRP